LIKNIFCQKLRCCIDPLELGALIKIAVVQGFERGLEDIERTSDIDHDAVGIELFGNKCRIDHEGRAVQCLRRSKNVSAKRMGNHDVVTDFDCKHGNSLRGK
jgi:hypothetical protein